MHDLLTTAKARVAARTNDDGFTLIELLVVIAVIGILAAITVFGVANFRASSEGKARCATQTTVTTAAKARLAEKGSVGTLGAGGAVGASSDLVTEDYLQAAPAHPTTVAANGVATTTGAIC